MQINVIASCSIGNASIISHKGSKLLIDAGINIKKLSKAANYQLTSFNGVLISHSHMDHCRAINDLLKMGIDCYMSEETIKALNCNSHRTHRIAPLQQEKIGSWIILPFDLIHDSKGTLGFLIAIDEYKLLYACDTRYIKYKFRGLTHIMVECNYDSKILDENIKSGKIPEIMKNRLMSSHMSFDTVKNFLKVNDLREIEEIWLLHLSKNNSDSRRFKEEIQKLTGKIVKIG